MKTAGKVLREKDGIVYVPFGSEYSLYLKNLTYRRCQVKIGIDGKSISGNDKFIIAAKGTIEIERFINNGNTCMGN